MFLVERFSPHRTPRFIYFVIYYLFNSPLFLTLYPRHEELLLVLLISLFFFFHQVFKAKTNPHYFSCSTSPCLASVSSPCRPCIKLLLSSRRHPGTLESLNPRPSSFSVLSHHPSSLPATWKEYLGLSHHCTRRPKLMPGF